MKSEQIEVSVQRYLASGRKIQVLPADNRIFYFPIEDMSTTEKLLDQFSFNLFEDDERFFDILD